jgi:hypothetical protein
MPNISVNRPQRVSLRGNVFKIPLTHTDGQGNKVGDYEIWTTKEAMQKHFNDMKETPREYQMRKFARQMYEKQLRSSNGKLQHNGLFVTSDSVIRGNAKLWPHTLVHPEIKM